ncbi:MAG: hypothetical protein U9R47_07745 [Actinomycetota bacterium]|nr:hypothetical protein [Actinomycetota bacterium]
MIKMVYYEIIVKKKDAPLYVNFEYKETVSSIEAREKARKKWKEKGYRVRTVKTRYAEPPEILYVYKRNV